MNTKFHIYFLYFLIAYVSPQRAHSWVVVVQSHNRGYRDTRLCLYMIFRCYIFIPIQLPATPSASSSTFSAPPFIRCLHRLPLSLQVQSLLSPPHFCHLCPRPPHRFLKQVQNQSGQIVLLDHIIPPKYIRLHLLQPRLLHRLIQGGILPTSTQKPLGMYPCDPSAPPVL